MRQHTREQLEILLQDEFVSRLAAEAALRACRDANEGWMRESIRHQERAVKAEARVKELEAALEEQDA